MTTITKDTKTTLGAAGTVLAAVLGAAMWTNSSLSMVEKTTASLDRKVEAMQWQVDALKQDAGRLRAVEQQAILMDRKLEAVQWQIDALKAAK